MKTKLFAAPPLAAVATAFLWPLGLHAQTGTPAEAPPSSEAASPSTPSSPSVVSTPTLPSTPSQGAGIRYPSSIFSPGSAFQPAGTQASTVTERAGPGLQMRAIAGVETESNVQRTSSGGSSDTAAILGVGLRADRRIGLQRLRADLEANTYRYDKDPSMNYHVFNYALAWDWSVTPRIHGVASADRKQYREISTDPVALVNRVGRRTERTELLEGVYEAGAAWRVTGNVMHTRSTSTEAATWDASPDVQSARVGFGYELASGTSLYVRYRRGDGEYTDPTPGAATGGFRENEADIVLKLPVSGKTSIDARLGHLERIHSGAGQARDFSGMVGSAAVLWDVTGKTRVQAGVSRELSATGSAAGGYVRGDRFFIGPVWKATPQVAVNLRYDYVERDWKDVPATSPEADRNESVRVMSAGVEWEPRRWLAVSGYVRAERQRSTLNTGYRNTTVGAAVKAFF